LSQRIAKYEVLEKIAEGGFGTVYKARDPFIKRLVAIKTCSVADEEMARRFFREAEIAGRFDHPNVTIVHDFGVEDQVAYLVQEYLSGEDLLQKIRRRDVLPLRTKIDYLKQVASGLAYAHSQHVIHRDIKPANLRVLESGQVKILDFGIAKLATATTQLTQKGMAVGTLGYLSPEQLRDQELDTRTDIFSFGVVAYELLTYTRPFQGKQLSTLMDEILHRTPPPVSQLVPDSPPVLDRLVARCLEKDRERRYSTFEEVAVDLEEVRRELTGREALPPLPAPGANALPPSESTGEGGPITRPIPLPPLPPVVTTGAVTTTATPPPRSTPAPPPAPRESPPPPPPTSLERPSVEKPSLEKPLEEPSFEIPALDVTPPSMPRPLAVPPPPAAASSTSAADGRAAAAIDLLVASPPPVAPPKLPSEHVATAGTARTVSDIAAPVSWPTSAAPQTPPPLPPTVILPLDGGSPPRAQAPAAATLRGNGAPGVATSWASEPAAGASAATPVAAPATATTLRRARPWLAPAAAVVALGLAAGAWLLFGGGDEASGAHPAATLAPTAPPIPVAPSRATVAVIGAPWGELVSLRGANGRELPLPERRETPLLLALPAGHYVATLRHPGAPQDATCEVDAAVGQAVTCQAQLIPLDSMQYFKEAGWWR